MELCPLYDEIASNSSNLVYFRFSFVFQGIVMTSLVALGLFGNVTSIILFCLNTISAKLSLYLITLAAWDLALLIGAWLMLSLTAILFGGRTPLTGPWVYTYIASYTLINTAWTGCIWVTVVVTVERYLAVCHPMTHKTLDHTKRARLILLSVSMLAVLFVLPRYFELDLSSCVHAKTNVTQAILSPSSLYRDQVYFMLYRVCGGLLFTSLVPFVGLAVLTTRMMLTVRRAAIQRRQLSKLTLRLPELRKEQHRLRRTDSRVNRMLLIVLVKFLVCYTLPTLIDLAQIMKPYISSEMSFNYLVQVSNVLVVLNSATHFVVYCVCCARFRHELQRMCACRPKETDLLVRNLIDMTATQQAVIYAGGRKRDRKRPPRPCSSSPGLTSEETGTFEFSQTEDTSVVTDYLGVPSLTHIYGCTSWSNLSLSTANDSHVLSE